MADANLLFDIFCAVVLLFTALIGGWQARLQLHWPDRSSSATTAAGCMVLQQHSLLEDMQVQQHCFHTACRCMHPVCVLSIGNQWPGCCATAGAYVPRYLGGDGNDSPATSLLFHLGNMLSGGGEAGHRGQASSQQPMQGLTTDLQLCSAAAAAAAAAAAGVGGLQVHSSASPWALQAVHT
jgi:hypothetical protein